MSVPGLVETRGSAPLLVLEGESGPPLSLWLAGYVISLLHETLTQALEAAAHGRAASPAWERRVEHRVAHADSRLVSLLFTDWSYTGGRPRQHDLPQLPLGARPRRVARGDPERPPPPRRPRQRLSDALLARLREADADWVTGGSVVQLSEERLGAFTLAPTGLTVHFAPYEVGPYAQGSFAVEIPADGLDGILRPEILSALARR